MPVNEEQIRNGVRNSAVGVTSGGSLTITSGRAIVGYNVQPSSSEWMLDLQTLGPYLLVIPSDGFEFETETYHTQYKIKVYLWYGFDRDSDNDFIEIGKLTDALRKKWSTFGAISGVGTPPRIDMQTEKTNPDVKPAIALYTFLMTFGGADD